MMRVQRNIMISACFVLMLLVLCGCFRQQIERIKEYSSELSVRIIPFVELDGEKTNDFFGIMGFSGKCLEISDPASHISRYYFIETKDGEVCIASSAGFPGWGEDIVLDVDNDGVNELVCNSVYGDGGSMITVYRKSGNIIECGRVDLQMYDELGAIIRSIREQYDPIMNQVIISYSLIEDPDNSITTVWDSFDGFTFEQFQSLDSYSVN